MSNTTNTESNNSVLNNIKVNASKSVTTNGDITYTTTYDDNLDFFFGASLFRNDEEQALEYFARAYTQDRVLALKNLFYLRDIKGGQGFRTAFRSILSWLAKYDEDVVISLLPKFVEYGRWDDILHLALNNQGYSDKLILAVSSFVKSQLYSDIEKVDKALYGLDNASKRDVKVHISLLAKWLPKINSSNHVVRRLAYRWANILFPVGEGSSAKRYRSTLKYLRTYGYSLTETALANKDYASIEYGNVPARAMAKYRKAFSKNDLERYQAYLDSLVSDTSAQDKLKERVKNLFPYEITRMAKYSDFTDKEQGILAEELWKALPSADEESNALGGNVLVVYDGSGSMWRPVNGTHNVSIADVAESLAIYASERTSEPFRNKVITFSRNPRYIEFKEGSSLKDKLSRLSTFTKAENTDIAKVYDLIYNSSVSAKPEDYLDKVLIITDCEFDGRTYDYQGLQVDESTYEVVKKKFKDSNIPMPTMVYWNLNADRVIFPSTDVDNVMLVSGYSNNVFKELANGNNITALDVMLSAISKYSFVDFLFEGSDRG